MSETYDKGKKSNAKIQMRTEDGGKKELTILSSKKDGDDLYLLAEETDGEGLVAILKCISEDDEDMVFQIIEEGHKDCEMAISLFIDEIEELDIEME